MNTIYFLLSGLVAGIILYYVKDIIVSKFKKKAISMIPQEDLDKFKDLYDRGLITFNKLSKEVQDYIKSFDKSSTKIESFSGKKLTTGLLKVNSGVLWAKDFASIFNLRKLIIVGVILGIVFGWGWYQGHTGKPVHLNLQGKEVTIKLNEHFLKIEKNGDTKVLDKNGKVIKVIKVKDIPELAKALRPYGLEVLPFFTAGGSVGTSQATTEVGLGVQLAHFYKMNYSPFITTAGVYPIGLGYNLTENSDLLLGYGIGYSGDTRYYGGIKFKF